MLEWCGCHVDGVASVAISCSCSVTVYNDPVTWGHSLPSLAHAGAEAFEAAVAAVSLYGGASAGYRTMLDALIPASKALSEVSPA